MKTKRLLWAAVVAAIVGGTLVSVDGSFTALTCAPAGTTPIVAGCKWGFQQGEIVRQSLNALVAPKYWVSTANSDLTNDVSLGALTSGLLKITVSASNATPSTATAGTDYTSPSSTETQTNKTLNAESTGNVLTLPFKLYLPAATCEEGGSYTATPWQTDGASFPTDACVLGTNVVTAEQQFSDGSTQQLFTAFSLPSDWTGDLDLRVFWRSSATSGNVVWQVQTACTADGETVDPAWNTAQTITDATQGTANRFNTAALSTLTTTGCSAGEMLWLRIIRDPSHASDTLGAVAAFLGAELTYRRAM